MSRRPPRAIGRSTPPLRPVLLAAAALLALSACHRGGVSDDSAASPAAPANATPEAPAPATVPAASAPAPAAPVSVDERRRMLRAEKDGEAPVERTTEYEGARSAATALPDQGDDAPPPPGQTPADTPPASPPPPGPPPG